MSLRLLAAGLTGTFKGDVEPSNMHFDVGNDVHIYLPSMTVTLPKIHNLFWSP